MDAVRQLAPGALVLDLAAGPGRHARAIAATGRPVIALDFVEAAVRQAVHRSPLVAGVVADAATLPLFPGMLPAIVCVNFLDRALFPRLIALLELGGFLVYETYTRAHLSLDVSGPRNPAYLLQPGELETLVAPLRILEYREGLRRDAAGERHVASVLARKDA